MDSNWDWKIKGVKSRRKGERDKETSGKEDGNEGVEKTKTTRSLEGTEELIEEKWVEEVG